MTGCRRHVLVAEDNIGVLCRLATALRSRGVNPIECASRGNLELALNDSPDGALIVARTRKPFGLSLNHTVPVVCYQETGGDVPLSVGLDEMVDLVERFLRGRPKARGGMTTLIVAGSTGGVPVLLEILRRTRLPNTAVVVCQHIGAAQSESLAERLRAHCSSSVTLLTSRKKLTRGTIHLLAGGLDWELQKRSNGTYANDLPKDESPYHPSADRLLSSARPIAAGCGVVVLSGLGRDGAAHLAVLSRAGARIAVQAPSNAIADSMPKAAIESGATTVVLEPERISQHLTKWAA